MLTLGSSRRVFFLLAKENVRRHFFTQSREKEKKLGQDVTLVTNGP